MHRFSQRLKLSVSVGEHAVNRKLLTLRRGLDHHVMYKVGWERDAWLFLSRWEGIPEMVMTERHNTTGVAVSPYS